AESYAIPKCAPPLLVLTDGLSAVSVRVQVRLWTSPTPASTMDILPSGNIFHELQAIHDTGFFPAQPSLEDFWQQ
ncbi:hypothetical protein HPB47_020093, partial [Ixodes persulcatus]